MSIKFINPSLLLLFLNSMLCFGQVDSVRFTNGQLIVGEIKGMDRGVLKMETDYSDSDFLIEWKEVVWLNTQSHFQISMENGVLHYSSIKSISDSISIIVAGNSSHLLGRYESDSAYLMSIPTHKIVFLNAYEDKFRDRFSAAIDFGIDLAKAQNLHTVTTRSSLEYKAERWSSNMTYNTLQTTQDETDPIKRSDGVFNFRYYLPRKWYLISTLSLLSNSEQKLDMRYEAQQGLGLFIVRTNSAYWGGKLGGSRNIERYNNETEDRDSWEAYLGTEFDLYDIGDFSLSSNIMLYQGITNVSRQRIDASVDLKYELPFDLYIRLGTSINYDDHPAEGASPYDYVVQTGFGWEW